MKRTLISLLLLGVFAIQANAQKFVYPLPLDSNTTVKGSTCKYMLSATAFKVDVTISKVRELKGHYSDYAEKLLGLSNVIKENSTHYELKNVSITPVQVPDMSQSYLVVLSSKQMKDGFQHNASQQGSIVGTYATNDVSYKTYETPVPDFFRNYSDPTYAAKEDAFVETKIIDGVVTQVPANKTKLVSKSSNQKAQEAADVISQSRKSQYNLVAGEQETAYSAEALERMLKELKDWENNYLSLFTGIALEDEINYTFYVTPNETTINLFSIDSNTGFSVDNLHGDNVYKLNLTSVLCPKLLNQEVANKTKINNGYRYRTAVPMQVTLMNKGTKLYDFGIINMTQFGRIQTLPVGDDKLDISTIGFPY